MFAQFTDKIAEYLEDEFRGNGDLLAAYVSYPHAAAAQSKSLSPRRSPPPGEERGEVWFPERAVADPAKRTVFRQAREHIYKMEKDI